MEWIKPDFEEICLAMEVTAYVNTDDDDTAPLLHRSTVETSETA